MSDPGKKIVPKAKPQKVLASTNDTKIIVKETPSQKIEKGIKTGFNKDGGIDVTIFHSVTTKHDGVTTKRIVEHSGVIPS